MATLFFVGGVFMLAAVLNSYAEGKGSEPVYATLGIASLLYSGWLAYGKSA